MSKPAMLPLVALLLGGCAVGPTYTPPALPAGAEKFRAAPVSATAPLSPEPRWWEHFGDPALNELVARARAQNLDLAQAAARLEKSRAGLARARWQFAPGGVATASVTRGQEPQSRSAESSRPTEEVWQAGGAAIWEIDLFGRNLRAHQKARALTELAAADLHGVQVAVTAEVAGSYVSLRAVRELHATVRRQLELLATRERLLAERERAGQATRLDALRLEQLRLQTEALFPGLEADEALHLHRLAVLLGEDPGRFTLETPPSLVPAPGHTLALGSPAELLRRRPDVAAAERRLAAAVAQVGVSTAELYPQVSVQGALRFVGFSSGELGAADGRGWSVSPTVTWNLLDWGRLRALREADRAEVRVLAAAHRQVTLRALEEMENALAGYGAAGRRFDLAGAAQGNARELEALARRQQQAGALSSFEVLAAEAAALDAQRDLVATRLQVQLSLITIYRALGGGWSA